VGRSESAHDDYRTIADQVSFVVSGRADLSFKTEDGRPTIHLGRLHPLGGASSVTGAVAGVVVITPVTEILRDGVAGVQLGSTMVALPRGAQEIGLRIIMGLVLIFRTSGRSLGRELPSPFREM
jgi:hypothetical protein